MIVGRMGQTRTFSYPPTGIEKEHCAVNHGCWAKAGKTNDTSESASNGLNVSRCFKSYQKNLKLFQDHVWKHIKVKTTSRLKQLTMSLGMSVWMLAFKKSSISRDLKMFNVFKNLKGVWEHVSRHHAHSATHVTNIYGKANLADPVWVFWHDLVILVCIMLLWFPMSSFLSPLLWTLLVVSQQDRHSVELMQWGYHWLGVPSWTLVCVSFGRMRWVFETFVTLPLLSHLTCMITRSAFSPEGHRQIKCACFNLCENTARSWDRMHSPS